MIEKEEEKCCGACCWFKFEDTEGWGYCPHLADGETSGMTHCSDLCTQNKFVSNIELRHHLAMLRKCQRCLHLMDHKDVEIEVIRR